MYERTTASRSPGIIQLTVLLFTLFALRTAIPHLLNWASYSGPIPTLSGDLFFLTTSLIVARALGVKLLPGVVGSEATPFYRYLLVLILFALSTLCAASLYIVDDGLPGCSTPPVVATKLIVGLVTAPIAEEIFFTGVLLPAFRQRARLPIAVLAVAVIFSSLHSLESPIILLMHVAYSVASSCLFLAHGKLWLNVLLHSVNNGVVDLLYATCGMGLIIPDQSVAAFMTVGFSLLAAAISWRFAAAQANKLQVPDGTRSTVGSR
jgi:membrane protease YdiL (CAAX protease family)